MLEQKYINNRVSLRKLLSRVHGFSTVRTAKFSHICQLHSVFSDTSQSIKALGRTVQNDLGHFFLFENLNPESQKAWETVNDGIEALGFDRHIVFLENRVRCLKVVEGSHSRSQKPERDMQMFFTEKKRSHKIGFSSEGYKVQTSQNRHSIWQCEKHRSITKSERKNFVISNRMCFNGLSANHGILQ